jgi:hypothetical protein
VIHRGHVYREHRACSGPIDLGIGDALCRQRLPHVCPVVGLDQGACFAAGAVLAIGMLTLGLPGAMFVEVLIPAGRKPPPDSAWPLAILITQVGALIMLPVSLALRFYTNVLASARLIELTPDAKWQVTRLGKTMMEPRGYWVH